MRKLISPLITISVIILSAILVLQAIRFISLEINKIFTINEARVDENLIKVDLEKFAGVAERLNITPPAPAEVEEAEQPSAEEEPAAEPEEE